MKEHDYTEVIFNKSKKFEDLEIYFDGCCEPTNPNGNMGYGWCLKQGKEVIAHAHGYQLYTGNGFTSNNISEWTACCLGLQFVLNNELEYKSLKVHGDSNLVIKQASGEWSINGGKGYSTVAFMFLDRFKLHFKKAKYIWIPRHQNDYCDELSKRYIKTTGTKLNETGFGRKKEKALVYKKPEKIKIYQHSWDKKGKSSKYERVTCIKCGCERDFFKERFAGDGYLLYSLRGEESLKAPNCIPS